MRCAILCVLLTATGGAIVSAQDGTTTTPRQQIGNPDQRSDRIRQQQFDQQRQSNWVDEARPAGANLPVDRDDAANQISAGEVRLYISSLANQALAPGHLNDVALQLNPESARRIEVQLQRLDTRDHDALLRSFREQWKARYGEELDLTKQTSLTSSYMVMSGERPAEDAIVASARRGNDNGDARSTIPPSDQPRTATLFIPGSVPEHQPPMVLVLMNTGGSSADWRLRVPDSLSAQRLVANLDQRLNRMLDGTTHWPADPREAYRLVAYQVIASLSDQPADRPKERPAEDRKPIDKDNPSLES